MDFNRIKLGYVPYLNDMTQPGNRRRFPYFAKRKNVAFEIADPQKDYDIVLINGQANLSKWLIYKKKHPNTKFIFEMTDSVIFPADIFRTLFKGLGRYLLGRETSLYFDYKTPVKKWLKLADLVICSSREVKQRILKYNENIIISLDYLESEYRFLKKEYTTGKKLKLVWEGLGVSLHHLLSFKEVFKKINSFCELHIITSEKFPGWGNLSIRHVNSILKQLPINTIFHPWDINTKDQILSDCDLGIIPLTKKNSFAWHKPANKLVSFWFIGLPVIVSDTPAYMDMMDDAGEAYYCDNPAEWISKIKEFKALSSGEKKLLSEKNHHYVEQHYSNEELDKVWLEIFRKMM
jgi:glycosyltransferase involved in cell wall biosynthesis